MIYIERPDRIWIVSVWGHVWGQKRLFQVRQCTIRAPGGGKERMIYRPTAPVYACSIEPVRVLAAEGLTLERASATSSTNHTVLHRRNRPDVPDRPRNKFRAWKPGKRRLL